MAHDQAKEKRVPDCAEDRIAMRQNSTPASPMRMDASAMIEAMAGRVFMDAQTVGDAEDSMPTEERGMELLIAIHDVQIGVIYTRKSSGVSSSSENQSAVDGTLESDLLAAIAF